MTLCLLHNLTKKQHLICTKIIIITLDFSSSGVFAALIIALEFCWQTQHKSVIGFMTVMWGVSFLQVVQNVLYAATLSPASSHDNLYCTHTLYILIIKLCELSNIVYLTFFVVFNGSSWRSSRLYPGILPGKSMALFSAYAWRNLMIFLTSRKLKEFWGVLFLFPWHLTVNPVAW